MPNEMTSNNGGAIVINAQRQTLVPATVEELKQQISVIQKTMSTLMKDETHYGVVPGCGKKKVLLKPGAELIMTLFRIGPDPKIEEISDGFDVRYRVIVRGFHIPTGNTVGYGVGEASTSEKKYKWRAAVCHDEWQDTDETRRQIAYLYDYDTKSIKKVEQVRQNHADILNTVLKMAKKRALVDLCLTATACSDIFVQDIDDPDVNEASGAGAQDQQRGQQNRYQQPRQRKADPEQSSAPAADVISEPQRKRLYAIGMQKGLSKDEMSYIVFEVGGVNTSNDIHRDKYDAVVAAFENATPGSVMPQGQ